MISQNALFRVEWIQIHTSSGDVLKIPKWQIFFAKGNMCGHSIEGEIPVKVLGAFLPPSENGQWNIWKDSRFSKSKLTSRFPLSYLCQNLSIPAFKRPWGDFSDWKKWPSISVLVISEAIYRPFAEVNTNCLSVQNESITGRVVCNSLHLSRPVSSTVAANTLPLALVNKSRSIRTIMSYKTE